MNRIPLAVFILDDDEGIAYQRNYKCEVKISLSDSQDRSRGQEGGKGSQNDSSNILIVSESWDFTNGGGGMKWSS